MGIALVIYLVGFLFWSCLLSFALALGLEYLENVKLTSWPARIGALLAVVLVLVLWPIAIPFAMLVGARALREGES